MAFRKNTKQNVVLNFLPLAEQELSFVIYRSKFSGNDSIPMEMENEVKKYQLPDDNDNRDVYADFLVRMDAADGFEPFTADIHMNYYLTLFYLHRRLQAKCKEVLQPNTFSVEAHYRNKINFIIKRHQEGHEIVWLEPYHLSIKNQFGFLIGYNFHVAEGYTLNKSILQKSLSLGPDGRENKNYYADNLKKIEQFLSKISTILFPLTTNNESIINIVTSLKNLQTDLLDTKAYIFSQNKRNASQFQGIKKYGPLEPVSDKSLICFMYRQEDKPLSHDLYYALRGDKYATFPGMTNMLSFRFDKEHVAGIPLASYEYADIESAISRLSEMADQRNILPIILFPWSRDEIEGVDYYYRIKHQFLSKRLPTQFVSLKRLRAKDGLKWSVANIALASFGKLGGKPWKVDPRNERCLIIGIGQAHRRNDGNISRYYAYSVLSDSSGLYDSIRVLSVSQDKRQYLNGLTERLKGVISEKADDYDKFVIHTPFKLRYDEMDAIKDALIIVDDKKAVVVMKFNEKSKFFGFEMNNNSKVPFESTCMPLGREQYLVWFEGLQFHNPAIKRRISRPMHIQFIYSNPELANEHRIGYLQDAINLSGANWRGFNAKTLPVSVYYSKLIAEYIGHFDRLGFDEVNLENMPPWFL